MDDDNNVDDEGGGDDDDHHVEDDDACFSIFFRGPPLSRGTEARCHALAYPGLMITKTKELRKINI